VFRLARALTFLWPGRAIGASRSGRVMRAVVLPCSARPPVHVGADDPLRAASRPRRRRARRRAPLPAAPAALRLLSPATA